ncbi:MAG TPA: hypothetical protein VNA04_01255 [Thermoanaerobaculia bacterium]|nr:hypothetical protein [Thermoanaerobaculia bacterium]
MTGTALTRRFAPPSPAGAGEGTAGHRALSRLRERVAEGRVRAVVLGVLLLLFAQPAAACPVCFGAPGDPMVDGASRGVFVLLGIVLFVQLGFVALFFSFWRRARQLKKFREQFHVIEGGSQ